jgi:RNA polymerase sigma-70 factor (ECF subfamily)
MTQTVLERARAGDEQAFRRLTEPHRRELQIHCYRMLGSLQDAEDAVQETLVSAWRGLDGYEQRASLRGWLYAIASHRCLTLLRERGRRPPLATGLPFSPPPATRMSEVTWLEPYPDRLLEELPDEAPGPDARYEAREAIGLAFVTALQRLPPRQRAALVLRDVLGFRAAEAAEMLGVSEATVTSALQRARATLESRPAISRERAPAPGSPAERALAEEFADAFQRGEMERVVALLTEDAWVTMPPEPYEYQGITAIRNFFAHTVPVRGGREVRMIETRANGQPAFGHYWRDPGELDFRLTGLIVIELAGERISAITRFGAANLPSQFDLPPRLPG